MKALCWRWQRQHHGRGSMCQKQQPNQLKKYGIKTIVVNNSYETNKCLVTRDLSKIVTQPTEFEIQVKMMRNVYTRWTTKCSVMPKEGGDNVYNINVMFHCSAPLSATTIVYCSLSLSRDWLNNWLIAPFTMSSLNSFIDYTIKRNVTSRVQGHSFPGL